MGCALLLVLIWLTVTGVIPWWVVVVVVILDILLDG